MFKQRIWYVAAGLNGLAAIFMGAVGAHVLHDPYLSGLVEKTSLYQLILAAALLALADKAGRAVRIARWLMLIGITLFCGSLYLKALLGVPSIFAPAGGMALMAGWLAVVFIR